MHISILSCIRYLNCVKHFIIFMLILNTAIFAGNAKKIKYRHEFSVGSHFLMLDNTCDLSFGPLYSGGVRIHERHLLEGALYLGRWFRPATDVKPITNKIMGTITFSYLHALVNVKDVFRAEIGGECGFVYDGDAKMHPFHGPKAKLSIGGKRVHWYVADIVSMAYAIDLVNINVKNGTYFNALHTGIVIRL